MVKIDDRNRKHKSHMTLFIQILLNFFAFRLLLPFWQTDNGSDDGERIEEDCGTRAHEYFKSFCVRKPFITIGNNRKKMF